MNIALTPELEQFVQAQLAQTAPSIQLQAELQKDIDDLAQGNYTSYTSAQDIATQIKTKASRSFG